MDHQSEINRIEQTYRELTASGKKILKLYSGNPTEFGIHFPAEILVEAYAEALRNKNYAPHPKGLLSARQAIADYYEKQDCTVDPANIIITSGTSESFFSLFSLLAKPGDHFLAPCPSYPLFEHIAKLAHVELKPYLLRPHERWEIDIENLKAQTNDKTRGIILISPHNPTGHVASVAQLEQIVTWANSRNLPIICDEVFSEFYFGQGNYPRVAAVTKPSLCFTLNGISKMFALPMLKLGWIAVTGKTNLVESAVDGLETIADTFLSCHQPIQHILPILFEKGRSFVDDYRRRVCEQCQAAVNILTAHPRFSLIAPEGGFYLMAFLHGVSNEEDFVIDLMKDKGVFVHPGYFYDYEDRPAVVMSYLADGATLALLCR
ncbi:MAG: pyridoxal phosphate-dependent aminotransferase [Deltaproteobacteria bacterium]|nr:pyridoxal phosphate-dependent aminotransferase [Deltaproteobacteria bacterium]